MPKFSVIVPVYNTEKYLRGCIESILAQSFTDFELILVDDGSPDNCGKICDDFAKTDSRIRVFHKENGGVSSARNLALDNAKGDYICFVDSDDTIGPHYLQILSPLKGEDYVLSGVGVLENDFLKPFMTHEDIFNNYPRYWLESGLQWPSKCSLAKKIIDTYNLRYNTSIKMGEDGLFNHIFLSKCRFIRRTTEDEYYYNNDNELSASHKYYPDRLEQEIMVVQEMKKVFSIEQIYRIIWTYWRGVINHYTVKGVSNDNKNIRVYAKNKLKQTYKSKDNRESIPFIRKHGSLDERLESFFMGYYKHILFKPTLQLLQKLSRIKNLVRSWH